MNNEEESDQIFSGLDINSPEHKARIEEQKRKIAEFQTAQQGQSLAQPEVSENDKVNLNESTSASEDPRLTAALEQQKKQRLYSDLLRGFQQYTAASGNIKADTSMADIMAQRAEEPVKQYRDTLARESAAKKSAMEEKEANLRMDEFQMRLQKSKLDFQDAEANSNPNSPQSKMAQDRVLEMQKKLGQPLNETQVRSQSGAQLFKMFDYLKEDLTNFYKNENARLDREQKEKSDAAMLQKEQARLDMEKARWDEGETRRKEELTRKQEKDKSELNKTSRNEARNVLKDLRATEQWKASEKASNAIDEISPLLEDAYKNGGQSLAMLGPRIAKGIAGEVGVLTERDVTRYVQNPALLPGMMDSITKITQGSLTGVSYENIKRLMEIVKTEAKRKREAAINNEAILFSRRNEIPVEEARKYLDSEFDPQGTESQSNMIKMIDPRTGKTKLVPKDKVEAAKAAGGKVVE